MTTFSLPTNAALRGQRGFSLVEILVGLVIAMIGVVLMMEVLLTSDQRTRTTSSGNDALSSGAVMMQMMQRDLVQAGYGFNTMNLLGCNLVVPTGPTIPIAPVTINPPTTLVPAGDPNTDTVLAMYGNDNGQPEGNAVYGVAGAAYTVQAPSAFKVGDYVVALPTSCSTNLNLARVTAITALTVTVDAAIANATILYNLGQAPKIVAYAVRNASLSSCDFLVSDCSSAANIGTNWQAVAGGIVSLRAQYGRDNAAAGSMDGIVDVWDQTTPANACSWSRASAVRFVLVARSSQYESKTDPTTGLKVCDTVTTAARTWSGSTATPPSTSTAPIDLTKNPDNTTNSEWQCYRYKTFETVAPTRNVVWMGTQAGC